MKFSVDNLDKMSIIKVDETSLSPELCQAIEKEAMALIDEKGVADIIIDARKVKTYCPETAEMLQMIQLSTAHLNGMFVLIAGKKEDVAKMKNIPVCTNKDEAMDLIFENQMQRHLIVEEDFDLGDFEEEAE
jgi:hypothetical protein